MKFIELSITPKNLLKEYPENTQSTHFINAVVECLDYDENLNAFMSQKKLGVWFNINNESIENVLKDIRYQLNRGRELKLLDRARAV